MRAMELYSGIGGLRLALGRSRIAASVVAAYDWDQTACRVYAANFGPGSVHRTDISTLTAGQLCRAPADLWLLSPACQPYTMLNPEARGAADPRARSFLHLINTVLPELAAQRAHPRYILVENVAGFQDSEARRGLVSALTRLGYAIAEFNLNPLQFGIPNSRLRYYLLAKLSPLAFVGREDGSSTTLDFIPPRHPQVVGPRCIRQYLDVASDDQAIASFKIPDRTLKKWGRLFDIVLPSATRSCCFTRGYTRLVEGAGSILSTNERLDTAQVFDEFLEAQSTGDEDAVRMLDRLGLRYFTPDELLRLFHFVDPCAPETTFEWPLDISLKSKYRLIGNSVNVEVVRMLIDYLFTEKGD